MTQYALASIIARLSQVYLWLIIAYVILSWFPPTGVVADIRRVLGSICEPFLGLFRRFIPPFGGMDISPIVAILVLQIATRFIVGLLT